MVEGLESPGQNVTSVNRMGWGGMRQEGQETGHFRGMPPSSGKPKLPRNSQAFLLKAYQVGLLS